MKINNKLFIGIVLFFFVVGIIAGIPLGMKVGQMILFEGANLMFKDSNINVTIDINETELVKQVNETFTPLFLKKMEK